MTKIYLEEYAKKSTNNFHYGIKVWISYEK